MYDSGRIWRQTSSPVVYRERGSVVERLRRHEHVYVDHRDRICRSIARPTHRFLVSYDWGPWHTFRYFYPYYHRKYVFVSLGGYWPVEYRYIRYYRYGYHPYRWYGYYPIAREIEGATYSYYTYNYYTGAGAGAAEYEKSTWQVSPADHTTFADVREKLAAQAAEEPYEETLTDRRFEEAVEAFKLTDYNKAAEMFAQAMQLAPDDIVLPFAHCQALLAGERYTEAAGALRDALAAFSPDTQDAFYPRGLYADEDILFKQIDQLAEIAGLYGFDADLQLLLGYQLLGIGELDAAVEPLRLAGKDLDNASSAAILLSILEKTRTEKVEDTE